jgi:hypothetical protein
MDKPIRFPISSTTRQRNKLGKHAVPCMVTERWLQFAKKSGGHFQDGEFISMEIMTLGQRETESSV